MSGIINATPAGTSPEASGLNNPLLVAADQKEEANLQPDVRADYIKLVKAGLHILLDKGLDGFMAKLGTVRDPVAVCAKSAVALALIMRKESKGVPPPMKAVIAAGTTLLFHGLDFIDRAKIARIAEPEIDRGVTIFSNEMFHKLGITPRKLQTMAGRVHGITQDPQAMAAISLKAGLTRHPMAATPTPLPQA